MVKTGLVRKIDKLGRVVLPIELRRTQGLAEQDPVEILVDQSDIIIRKYIKKCGICGIQDSALIKVSIAPKGYLCESCLCKLYENLMEDSDSSDE